MTIASGELAAHPRYSFRATQRRGLGLGQSVRLDFYESRISIYRRKFHFLRDGEYSLLRTVAYSKVRSAEFLQSKVESSRLTFAGFAWGKLPAEIELEISEGDAIATRPGVESSWSISRLRFGGEGMTDGEFNGMYSWLRMKMDPRVRAI